MGMTRLIERDKDSNVWFVVEHCFFFVCLLCGQSTRSIASDFEGV